jgi:ApbE superfamily uncharacterized protein (UPF0280 family)
MLTTEKAALSLFETPVSFERGLYRARRVVKQSNLLFISNLLGAIHAAARSVLFNRALLESYIACRPLFMRSLDPIQIEENAPEVVRLASDAAVVAKVGPFAAVPGAIADLALREMLSSGGSVCLVENGGEIAANSRIPLNVGLYAGSSPVSGRVGFRIESGDSPVGIATSSATVSHALNFGRADAAVAVADTAALADASATAICNVVNGNDLEASVQAGLEVAEQIPNLRGALVVRGRYVGSVGKLPRLLNLRGQVEDMFRASLQDLPLHRAVIL